MSVHLFEYTGEGQIGHGKGRMARCLPGGVAVFHDPADLRLMQQAAGREAFREIHGEEAEAVCVALGVKSPDQIEGLAPAFVVETLAELRRAARFTLEAARRLAAAEDAEDAEDAEPAPRPRARRKAKPAPAAPTPLTPHEEG